MSDDTPEPFEVHHVTNGCTDKEATTGFDEDEPGSTHADPPTGGK